MFTGLGKLPSHFNPDLNISPEFPRGFSFHLQPKFPRGFPPPTTAIPGDSPQNPRDFARWAYRISWLEDICFTPLSKWEENLGVNSEARQISIVPIIILS